MNKKLKRKIVASLRGGTWQKITGKMMAGDRGRCALGVAYEVLSEEARAGAQYQEVMDAVGGWDNYTTILRLNDYQGLSFNQIADYIEEHL
jgi:hypothetical protein